MNTPADSQVTSSALSIKPGRSLRKIITDKFEGFKVPFSERRALLVSMDGLLVFFSAGIAFVPWQLKSGIFFNLNRILDNWYMFPILIGGWWLLASLNDLYDIPSSVDKALSATRVTMVGVLALPIYLIGYFLAPPHALPRLYFLFFLFIALTTIVIWRWIYSTLFTTPSFRHRVLIVGNGQPARSIASVLNQLRGFSYNVLGYVETDSTTSKMTDELLPVVGQTSDLPELVKQLRVREVILAIERQLDARLFQSLIECQAGGVSISLMANLYEKLYRRVPIEHANPDWALQGIQGKAIFSRLQLALKRLVDIVLATFGILILIPFLPIVALVIYIDSPGPIFYRQIRSGRAGKPFYIIKFRTMCTDAEKDGKARWAIDNDTRITRVGRLLRKTRIDETPQLLNILLGEMSIVGPRPERPEFVAKLQETIPFYYSRLMAKPGLTGWAQVNYDYGKNEKDAFIKLQYDFYYLRYWSLWLDIYIIFRTIGVILRLKGM